VTRLLSLGALVLVAGCVQAPPRVLLAPFPAMGQTPLQQEIDNNACLLWAQLNAAQIRGLGANAAASAIGGGALGAAEGAVIGSFSGVAATGSAAGAAVGGILGLASGLAAGDQLRQDVTLQGYAGCMIAHGYVVR
jgi:hypothetical protein